MHSFSISKLINEFENKEISKMMSYYQAFFNLIFPVYYTMLKYYSYSFYKESFFLILEHVNLLMLLFSKPVSIIIIFESINSSHLYGKIVLSIK
jgi:hypothetical protein